MNTKLRLFIYMLFAFTMATSAMHAAASQSVHAADIDHPLSLAELVDIALKNNPQTRQVWWNAQRAAAALGSARSAYYPSVGLSGSVVNGRDFKFLNGPDVSYTIAAADLTISLLLYDSGGRKAAVNSAKYALLAANWQSDWTLQKVMVSVLENAYSLLHSQETLQAALISLQEAERMLDAAKQLNSVGLSPISDVYTSQATWAQSKMDVAQQKGQLEIQMGQLAVSLGLSADTLVQLVPLEVPAEPYQQMTCDLIRLAVQQRADLMAKRARVSETWALKDKAKAAYGPKVSLSGLGGAHHALEDRTDAGQYRIALNFEMPLFNGFETSYNNRLAYANAQTTIEEMAQLELDIAMEVLTYSSNVGAAREMLAYADQNLDFAKKAYEAVWDKYNAGKDGIFELSNAQRQLATARIRYSDVKTRLLAATANLAYATGTYSPYMEVPCHANP